MSTCLLADVHCEKFCIWLKSTAAFLPLLPCLLFTFTFNLISPSIDYSFIIYYLPLLYSLSPLCGLIADCVSCPQRQTQTDGMRNRRRLLNLFPLMFQCCWRGEFTILPVFCLVVLIRSFHSHTKPFYS